MVLIGAYFHDDEDGGLHCHIDCIRMGHGFKKGMKVQASLNRALQNRAFERVNRVFGTHNIDLEKAIEKVEDRIMPSGEEQESLIERRRKGEKVCEEINFDI